jgi:hypothetical protein
MTNARHIRKYRVFYSVTRTEHYEIEAPNPEEAEAAAFFDGELLDDIGDTTDVVALSVTEVESPRNAPGTRKTPSTGQLQVDMRVPIRQSNSRRPRQ